MKRLIFSIAFIVLIAALSGLSRARVTGECSNCHTMHNSQGGTNMQIGYDPATDAQASLLRANGCLGCHATSLGGTWQGVGGAPIVYNTSVPTYGDGNVGLAAGNFYYTKTASGADNTTSRGHSLTCVGFADNADTPTGQRTSCATNDCHQTGTSTTGLQGHGCEACHLPAHHKGDTSGGWADADDGYYRFLGPIRAADGGSDDHVRGVRGYEDDDWQKTCDSSDHNEYSGEDKNGGYFSISHFCAGCHSTSSDPSECKNFCVSSPPEKFHAANLELPDPEVSSYDGYVGYNGPPPGGPWDYEPMLPIARSDIATGGPYPYNKVSHSSTDHLMCLTCHRAHASPYDNMLRWDNMLVLGDQESYYGCIGCHNPDPIMPP